MYIYIILLKALNVRETSKGVRILILTPFNVSLYTVYYIRHDVKRRKNSDVSLCSGFI